MRKALIATTTNPVRTVFVAAFAVSLGAAAGAGAAMAGCDRPGGQVVALNGAVTTAGVCIGPCYADPGSAPANCSLATQVDTLTIESFDNFNNNGSANFPLAQDWYSYTDGTAVVGFVMDDGGYNDAGYQPAVMTPDPAIMPCQPTNVPIPGVLHAFGGPWLGWGGGMGITMAKVNGRDPENSNVGTTSAAYYINVDTAPNSDPNAPKGVCCASTNPSGDPANKPQGCPVSSNPNYAAVCPPLDGGEFAVKIATIDVSAYDGVSFWARRGPNSQTGVRVNIGDKYTDDDLNYLAQRQEATDGVPQPIYCRRNRECDCLNHQTCGLVTGNELADAGNGMPATQIGIYTPSTLYSFCGVPHGIDLASGCGSGYGVYCAGLNGGPFTCCNQTNCQQPYPGYPCDKLPGTGAFANTSPLYANGDIQYYNAPCTPYAFDNGISGSYCYNPQTDPVPAPPTELCGDFWMTTVDLSTNWQWYQVPFTVLHQQGFAKKSEYLDLHSVSTIRFTWDIGWIDYYIDEVGFYRQKQ